ncbi:hypothetical protein COLO4_21532 [Corchorus olitorius]|uniref:Uncharacterized protein n=1 Tax=Corchorus olitorius TaxID=93759 RepID=A0A1R3ISS3_9ROSI|nr:hypothetical protein COLO4_21532 [Corchorus olitorius]
MSVMVTSATTWEERFADMERKMAALEKTVEDKDLEIIALKNQLEAFNDDNHSDASDIAPGRLDADVNQKDSIISLSEEVESVDNDDEEWILVTRRKSRKCGDQHPKNALLSRSSQRPQNVPLNKNQQKIQLCPFFRKKDNECPNVLKSDFSPEVSEQKFPKPVKLEEFFPKGFLNKDEIIVGVHAVSITEDHERNDSDERSTKPANVTVENLPKATIDENLKNLKGISSRLTIVELLQYPKVVLRRKEGQSPFSKPLEFKDAELLLGETEAEHAGFVRPSEGAIEHGTFHQEGTVQSYGPNAYKLIAKAGFDLSKPTAVDELHTEKTTKKLQGITDAHKN